jgi:hypothetical protein
MLAHKPGAGNREGRANILSKTKPNAPTRFLNQSVNLTPRLRPVFYPSKTTI